MDIILQCPYCNLYICIHQTEINCAIFRHGCLKTNLSQIPPHLSKVECENKINSDSIFGCGKPFKLVKVDNAYTLVICDYI